MVTFLLVSVPTQLAKLKILLPSPLLGSKGYKSFTGRSKRLVPVKDLLMLVLVHFLL
jgi:hypothetical protein